jgi:hypothetical protein
LLILALPSLQHRDETRPNHDGLGDRIQNPILISTCALVDIKFFPTPKQALVERDNSAALAARLARFEEMERRVGQQEAMIQSLQVLCSLLSVLCSLLFFLGSLPALKRCWGEWVKRRP